MGQIPGKQWLGDYVKAFASGVNPMTSILDGMSENTDRMHPAPGPATPPTPQRWWRPEEAAHPLYPIPPAQGVPSDFSGAVLPNPNNIRPQLDTDSPATTRLTTGAGFNRDNFRGTMPRDISNPAKAQLIPRTPKKSALRSF